MAFTIGKTYKGPVQFFDYIDSGLLRHGQGVCLVDGIACWCEYGQLFQPIRRGMTGYFVCKETMSPRTMPVLGSLSMPVMTLVGLDPLTGVTENYMRIKDSIYTAGAVLEYPTYQSLGDRLPSIKESFWSPYYSFGLDGIIGGIVLQPFLHGCRDLHSMLGIPTIITGSVLNTYASKLCRYSILAHIDLSTYLYGAGLLMVHVTSDAGSLHYTWRLVSKDNHTAGRTFNRALSTADKHKPWKFTYLSYGWGQPEHFYGNNNSASIDGVMNIGDTYPALVLDNTYNADHKILQFGLKFASGPISIRNMVCRVH